MTEQPITPDTSEPEEHRVERGAHGHFAPGNRGGKKGRTWKVQAQVLKPVRNAAQALGDTVVRLALAGDPAALRLCLERVAPPPKDSPVAFALPPLVCAADATAAASAVLAAVGAGELTPREGASVMALVEGWRRTFEASELEARLAALEAAGAAEA